MRSCLSRRDALLLGGAASVGLATRGLLLPSAYAQQPQPKRGGVMHVAEDDFDSGYARSGARQQRHGLLPAVHVLQRVDRVR